MKPCRVEAALFDFGGVLADEGFKNGLHAIARANKKDPETFAAQARELIHDTGYLTGHAAEPAYWEALRVHAGISGEDSELRNTILRGFTLRPWMIEVVERLRDLGVRLAILSDQTNWLDELEEKLHFFHLFERVFNSYHMGKCKRDQSLFTEVTGIMGLEPSAVLFVDDTCGHVERARAAGLKAIWFQGREDFLEEIALVCPAVADLPGSQAR